MKAGLYLRISQDQTGEALGVTRQEQDCRALAEQLGWEVAEVYVDNDISAASGKARPGYDRMMKAVGAREIDAIIAWHADRLYRRMADLTRFLAIVKGAKAQVATVKAGLIDLSTDSGQMIAEILASVAAYEGRAKATRWKRSIQQRREAGKPPTWGPRLFGYTRDYEIDETEADTARWLAAEAIDGVGLARLCHKLRERGVQTTLGNDWQVPGLRKYLTNPRIAGYSTLSRMEPTGEVDEKTGEPIKTRVTEIVGPGTWEPILDPETWETVRAIVTAGGGTRGNAPRVALLAGLIYCGGCGQRMLTGSRTMKSGGTQRVYRCSRLPQALGCGKISGRADKIEEVVEAYARAKLDDPRTRERLARLQAATGTGDLAVEMVATEERIRELEAQLDEPGVPVASIGRAITRAQERLATMQDQVRQAPPGTLPERGAPWPPDLQRRRRLVALGLEDCRVYLDPAVRPGVLDLSRVRIE